MRRNLGAMAALVLAVAVAGCGGLSADEQHGTAVAIARSTASVVHATGTARAVVQETAVTRQRVAATARAIAQKTAAPKETATAAARATADSAAQAAAQATANAQSTADAQATSQAQAQANAAATAAAQPSGDTYADVRDHPDAHQGDIVQWTCNIYNFLDQNTIGCWEYTGTYDGATGDGSLILDVSGVDTSSMHQGDDVQVYGTVTEPAQGTNSYGGTISNPSIIVKSITDLGHDPNAS